MTQFSQLRETLAAAEEDAAKFYDKGNAQAGKRLRKVMMDVRTLAKGVRDEIQAAKKAKKA